MSIGLICLILGLLLVIGGGSVVAWDFYQKNIDTQGRMQYTAEATTTVIRAVSMNQVDVTLDSNDETVAARVYTVHLYLDNVDTAQQTVSWGKSELGGGSPQTLNFTGLDLSTVVIIDVETVH